MTRRIQNPDTPADTTLKEVLAAADRPSFVMLAGAGSGKTTSLVKALDFIAVRHGATLRASGQQVACITYTEVAVAEIWRDVGNLPLYHVSTIHSFLWDLIKPFQANIAAWVIDHMRARWDELREERDNFGVRVQARTRERNAQAIDRLEQDIPQMGEVRQFTYGTGSNYRRGILGHDDIIKMGPALIQRFPLLQALLARKYPFFFVDESQDTFPNVVEALRAVAIAHPGRFTLGFFGDPMQKIYATGVGDIAAEPAWRQITKPENFRCPGNVLDVINRIRAPADGLEQVGGRHEGDGDARRAVSGSARMFVLPTDQHRQANLIRVRQWLADADGDRGWQDDGVESDVRILVIEHRMAANRLDFADLHAAFVDDAPIALSDGFRDGTAWPLRPFRDVLLPLAEASVAGHAFNVIATLRNHSPILSATAMLGEGNPRDVFARLKQATEDLAEMMAAATTATILDVLRFAAAQSLLSFDDRLAAYIDAPPQADEAAAPADEADSAAQARAREASVLRRYFACPASQAVGYHRYQAQISRYATHQGVKGAEFGRVIVLIDDDESQHRQFSYEKLLGLRPPSQADLDNRAQGKESVFERTRRLLYVCCSRATKDLVVVLYTADPPRAAATLRAANLFAPECIHEAGEF